MSKKRVSADELSWIVQEELTADIYPCRRVSIAIVPDDQHGCGHSLSGDITVPWPRRSLIAYVPFTNILFANGSPSPRGRRTH